METKKSYPFLVWITSIFLLSPVFWLLFMSLYDGRKITKPIFHDIDLFWGFSLFSSIPIFFFYWIAFLLLGERISSPTILKWILAGIVVLGIIIMFAFTEFDSLFDPEAWTLIGAYCLSVVIASFIFRIQKKVPDNQTDSTPRTE